jgi:hypothetical protein
MIHPDRIDPGPPLTLSRCETVDFLHASRSESIALSNVRLNPFEAAVHLAAELLALRSIARDAGLPAFVRQIDRLHVVALRRARMVRQSAE